jgi:UDP-N-acetylglucosamine 1-carboxyvinyltransferase
MDKIKVVGQKKIKGEVQISGAKNSALPIIFSTLICPVTHKIKNVPDLVDVNYALKILTELGAEVSFDKELNEVTIIQPDSLSTSADYDLVRKMRASILVLGPLLARFGKAKVSLPGGCAIGTRPIDQHLKAIEQLGAQVKVNQGYVEAESKKLFGAEIFFDQPTVGGTENALMAAVLAKGTTQLNNVAREPEIEDLAICLNAMGAKITGQGTGQITVEGVESLKPLDGHSVIGDRIEAGTFAVVAAITRSDLSIKGCDPKFLSAFLSALSAMGVPIEKTSHSFTVFGSKINKLVPTKIKTAPHPGFPTDLQAQIMTLMTQADGVSLIEETIFENRFMHVQELVRLGAEIKTQMRIAQVFGPRELKGAPVMATDLRASASLILAGLCAEGETTVSRIYHLDRGYEKLEKKLSALGADVRRV